MNKDYHFPYSILSQNIICEYKIGQSKVSDTLTLHNHDGYEIYLFLNGDAALYVESFGKKMERGDLLMVSPYSFHGLNLFSEAGYERLVINIQEDYIHTLNDDLTDLTLCFRNVPANHLNMIHLTEEQIETFLSISAKLEHSLSDTSYGQSVLSRAYLSELLVLTNQLTTFSDTLVFDNVLHPLISKTLDYVKGHLTENLTVELIAKELHHNSDYLSRLFKNIAGCSLKHYITAKKITLAGQFLREGYSPNDVCYMVGYSNYSSFSRRFTEETGCSPKHYQKKTTNP